ncbi:hypothetical protein CHLRE_01g005850v5 [Chlamydomonas reinhardtii]|uniref:Corrinoid adenosyltransferase MMAB n=1 Tax=Chlamydomonas reinhardtii TaxID=3055 RepID=A0A2K3E513_CHLRE|nr:uncharacterized protein CHLRE_01g005850v5 [Chlamydomonas reinhardtii]PNW87885.1 hypothetical protein CHLRE_01g005850v5 [Chlamydomonas reinhardtii]
MKIYTRSGDAGQASLFNGERLYKDDDVFQALGDVDELNSALGVASAFITNTKMLEQLETIQSRLIDVGSAVATPLPTSDEDKLQRTHFAGKEHTEQLEAWIDAMDEDLPKLTKFILPSGGQAAACLHHARSVCRRAERSVVVLSRRQAVSSEVNMYVNRLSDYLFTAARHAAMTQGAVEKVYQKARS